MMTKKRKRTRTRRKKLRRKKMRRKTRRRGMKTKKNFVLSLCILLMKKGFLALSSSPPSLSPQDLTNKKPKERETGEHGEREGC